MDTGYNASIAHEGRLYIFKNYLKYSDPKVTYSYPKVTYSDPRVTYSDPKVTYSDPKMTHSDPTYLPLPQLASAGYFLLIRQV